MTASTPPSLDRRQRCALASIVLVSSLVCASPAANAQTAAQDARAFFERGLAASRAQQWLEAHDDFERSLALEPRVSTYFNLAVVCLRLQRGRATLLALDAFEQRADPRTHEEFLSDSVALRARALDLTGTLELAIAPAPAHTAVYVDQEAQPLTAAARHEIALDPGAHRLTLQAEGFTPQSLDFNLDVGQRLAQSVSLAPLPVAIADEQDARAQPAPTVPQPQERTRLRRAWIWGGAAAVLIGVAVATAITLTRDTDPTYASGSTRTLFNPP